MLPSLNYDSKDPRISRTHEEYYGKILADLKQKNTLRLLKNILYRIDKYFKHIV